VRQCDGDAEGAKDAGCSDAEGEGGDPGQPLLAGKLSGLWASLLLIHASTFPDAVLPGLGLSSELPMRAAMAGDRTGSSA
jgi:hypothetical protein